MKKWWNREFELMTEDGDAFSPKWLAAGTYTVVCFVSKGYSGGYWEPSEPAAIEGFKVFDPAAVHPDAAGFNDDSLHWEDDAWNNLMEDWLWKQIEAEEPQEPDYSEL